MTVGQASPRCRPLATTVAQTPSTTSVPARSRSRVVSRARAGTAGSDSVNEPSGHSGSRQYHRRLTQTSRSGVDPHGRSRGLVVTTPLTRSANTPQRGQARAAASAVASHTWRDPSGNSSTRRTSRPSRSSRQVASLV